MNRLPLKILFILLISSMLFMNLTISPPAVKAAPCPTELFFSEYIEPDSDGNNKALEIYNGTGSRIELTGYRINLYSNGGTSIDEFIDLSGFLEPGATLVVAHPEANNTDILAALDIADMVANFNGDDVVELRHAGVSIDRIGIIDELPVRIWSSGSVSTADQTLRRNPTVMGGNADGFDAALTELVAEWGNSGTNVYDGLGEHDIAACGGDDPAGCPADFTPAYAIQGSGFLSLMAGDTVTTCGVVVGLFEGNQARDDGFYLQDMAGDGDTDTSDAVFVLSGESVEPGSLVVATGRVEEFSEWGGSCGDECLTRIVASAVRDTGETMTLPAASELLPPGDAGDAALYWEQLEGMLVRMSSVNANVVAPTNYGAIAIVDSEFGIGRVMRRGLYAGTQVGLRHYERGGKIGGDWPPNLIVGSVVSAVSNHITGPLAYTFGEYMIITQASDPWRVVSALPAESPAPSWPPADDYTFTAATFNVKDFYDADNDLMGKTINTIERMGCPTFLVLEETKPSKVRQLLGDSRFDCNYETDFAYSPVDETRPPGVSEEDFRPLSVAILWDATRISDVTWSTHQACSVNGNAAYDDPDIPEDDIDCAPGEYPLFPRQPVVVTASVAFDELIRLEQNENGEFIPTYEAREIQVAVIGLHLKSKLGGAASDELRLEQALSVNDLATEIGETKTPYVLVMGDMNDFEDSPPLQALYNGRPEDGDNIVLRNAWRWSFDAADSHLPQPGYYSYIHNGVSQILDHVLVSSELTPWPSGLFVSMSPLHYNADYPFFPFSSNSASVFSTSDHDPVIATFGELITPDVLDCAEEFLESLNSSAMMYGETSIPEALYLFRDKVMAGTKSGQELIEKYYRYSPNLAVVVLKQPWLAKEFWNTLEWVTPSLERYVYSQNNNNDIFTKARYYQIEKIYNTIQQYGDKNLAGAVSLYWQQFQLKSYIGSSMDKIVAQAVYKFIGK